MNLGLNKGNIIVAKLDPNLVVIRYSLENPANSYMPEYDGLWMHRDNFSFLDTRGIPPFSQRTFSPSGMYEVRKDFTAAEIYTPKKRQIWINSYW